MKYKYEHFENYGQLQKAIMERFNFDEKVMHMYNPPLRYYWELYGNNKGVYFMDAYPYVMNEDGVNLLFRCYDGTIYTQCVIDRMIKIHNGWSKRYKTLAVMTKLWGEDWLLTDKYLEGTHLGRRMNDMGLA